MLEFFLLLAAIAVGAYVYRRMQRGAYVTVGVIAAPAPIRAAAKRLGYRAQPNVHSINTIHTPELCVASMAAAFAQMDKTQQLPDEPLIASLQNRLQVTKTEASDMAILAPWLVAQGGGATPAFQHLTKRLKQLDHGPDFDKLMRVLGDVTAAGSKGMPSPAQADAMGALARIFRTA
ncbi:hypothetical protein [Sulfitobacter sp.]|jgi:hypothetical protein|uniref:hypothetical protein n=1 Tax=Sulfitobacter sp. TaxID=1903071 RepID=UPI003EF258E9